MRLQNRIYFNQAKIGPTIVGFTPDLVLAQDYYPFGMTMPGRKYSSGGYRFGFNGMEKDDELKGDDNSYDFGAKIYDLRIGRWASVDAQAMATASNQQQVIDIGLRGY